MEIKNTNGSRLSNLKNTFSFDVSYIYTLKKCFLTKITLKFKIKLGKITEKI
jgi:hypothetical protein